MKAPQWMPGPMRTLLALDPPDAYTDEHEGEDQGKQDKGAAGRRPRATSTAWEPVHESRSHAAGRKVGMVVLWSAVLLLLVLGVRSLISGGSDGKPAATAATRSFPEGDARAVAERFITNYLTLPGEDQGAIDKRKAALALDTSVDLGESWNGQGTQRVTKVLPGEVRITSTGQAQVTLLVQVTDSKEPSPSPTAPSNSAPSSEKGAKPSAAAKPTAAPTTAPQDDTQGVWLTVVVPVQSVSSRVVVSGAPSFTSNPGPGQVRPAPADPDSDSALTTRTRGAAQAFFKAWAGNDPDALAATTAPGAKVSPLGTGVAFVQLGEWRVFAPTGNSSSTSSAAASTASTTAGTQERTGRATVSWRLPSGATFTQTYRVRLQAVTGSGFTDWRMAEATAAQ